MSFDNTVSRTGTYSLKAAATSGVSGSASLTLGTFNWQSQYIRVTARPATTARVIRGAIAAGTPNIRLNPNGTLACYNNTTLIGTSTTALTDTNRWYQVNFTNTSPSASVFLQIDGVTEVSGTATFTAEAAQFGPNDTVADTYTVYFDDFARDDAVSPGSFGIALLVPTSLNAAGGWVEGDGAGTAGMAAAVATRPPPGVVTASETSATNIESPTNGTDNCDMNMTTYLAAGVGLTDTINAVIWLIRHGEDAATGTKTGSGSLISNPAQGGSTAFTYGNDAGVHGAEPGLWKTAQGPIIVSPSVTIPTAPVLRVTKDTGTTRVVCVDFMGIYVNFTPRPLPNLPKNPHYHQLLAH